jgi:peroxiredoxin
MKLKPVLGGFALAVVLAWGALVFLRQPMAPALDLVDLRGEAITSASLKGKVVLVNFWATSCVTCVREMPQLVETFQKYREQGYDTLAVAMSYDPPDQVLAYANKNELPFKVALDVRGDVARDFGDILLTPTSFLIDRQGRIIKRYLGEPDFAELHRLVEQLLRQPV